jgi:hypothetical protein
MIRPRYWSVLAFAALLVPALWAKDKSASPWAVDRSLTLSPAGEPVPALQYRLLPLASTLKEGNAVPIYLRLIYEQNDAARKYWSETPRQWNLLPVEKTPLAEVRKFLQEHQRFLRQLEVGARRRTAEWNYTLDEANPIGLLLPDVQAMRNYVPMLILQARVALAEGDFPAAAHHLETGFAFSRHVADGPTLIHRLIGFALASQFADAVADFIERPGAPNLYWALTALPRPLIDIRGALEWEYRMLEMQIPELGELDHERTPEQWDAALKRVRTALWGDLLGLTYRKGQPKQPPDWYPKDAVPEDPASKSPELPMARKFVAQSRGLSAAQVEAMPAAQVLLLYMVGIEHEDRDDFYRGYYLPYPQARPAFAAAAKRLRAAPASEGHVWSRMLMPALNAVTAKQVAVERNLAALRVVEALRIHAALHDGKLPDKLDDVTLVPIPNDPGTGGPFEYRREGDTATLVSTVPDDPLSVGLRYRLTVRQK